MKALDVFFRLGNIWMPHHADTTTSQLENDHSEWMVWDNHGASIKWGEPPWCWIRKNLKTNLTLLSKKSFLLVPDRKESHDGALRKALRPEHASRWGGSRRINGESEVRLVRRLTCSGRPQMHSNVIPWWYIHGKVLSKPEIWCLSLLAGKINDFALGRGVGESYP